MKVKACTNTDGGVANSCKFPIDSAVDYDVLVEPHNINVTRKDKEEYLEISEHEETGDDDQSELFQMGDEIFSE